MCVCVCSLKLHRLHHLHHFARVQLEPRNMLPRQSTCYRMLVTMCKSLVIFIDFLTHEETFVHRNMNIRRKPYINVYSNDRHMIRQTHLAAQVNGSRANRKKKIKALHLQPIYKSLRISRTHGNAIQSNGKCKTSTHMLQHIV